MSILLIYLVYFIHFYYLKAHLIRSSVVLSFAYSAIYVVFTEYIYIYGMVFNNNNCLDSSMLYSTQISNLEI